MTPAEMAARTKRFAVDVVRFCERLPGGEGTRVIARQLLRAATSVGANYRAVQRGRSRAEFIAELGTVEEEADAAAYWLELLRELGVGDGAERERPQREACGLRAIVVSARKTARSRP